MYLCLVNASTRGIFNIVIIFFFTIIIGVRKYEITDGVLVIFERTKTSAHTHAHFRAPTIINRAREKDLSGVKLATALCKIAASRGWENSYRKHVYLSICRICCSIGIDQVTRAKKKPHPPARGQWSFTILISTRALKHTQHNTDDLMKYRLLFRIIHQAHQKRSKCYLTSRPINMSISTFRCKSSTGECSNLTHSHRWNVSPTIKLTW